MPTSWKEWRRCTEESVAERLGGAVNFMTNQMDPDAFLREGFYTVLAACGYARRYEQTDL